MGTKVQGKNYLPGYISMRDLNEDSNNSCNWPLYYEDKSLPNGQYCNGFFSTPTNDSHPGRDKDLVKQTMLEHEATFKNQVYELHRLYRIQRDMMDSTKRKEHNNYNNPNRIPVGASWPSSPLASQITSEDHRRRTNYNIPFQNSVHERPSTSGVEAIHSPYSSQNGSSMKEIEALESRPMKVQRKLFGHRIDVDMDEGERVSNGKITAISGSDFPRSFENGFKFGGEDDARKAEDRRSPNGLVDLNEPCRLEDANEAILSSYEFCTGRIDDSAQFCKPKDITVNSYGSEIDTRNQLLSHKIENGRGWLCHVPEVAQGKSTVQSLPRFLQTDSPHFNQQTQVSSSNVADRTFYLSDKINGRLQKDDTVFGAETSRRTLDLNNIRNLGPISTPSWPHSWEKPSSSFNQRPRLGHGSPSDGILGDRWHLNRSTNSNPAFLGGERMMRNGFHHQGSLLGTKEQPIQIPSSSAERTLRRSDMKPPKDMNLNEAVSGSSSDTEMRVSEAEVSGAGKKREDSISIPSWLRPKPRCEDVLGNVSKTSETRIFQPCNQRSVESVQLIPSCSGFQAREVEPSDHAVTRKLLGFPIFESPNDTIKNESSSRASGAEKPKKMLFDMNVAIDSVTPHLFNLNEESVAVEIETQAESTGLRHQIDLNMCLSGDDNDDENSLSKPSYPVSRERGIDLEALPSPIAEEELEASPTSPEHKSETKTETTDELATAAAEAIVAMAALETPPEKNPLTWFVEIASRDDLGDNNDDEDVSEESDYFENAILQLSETKEEDYMPPPPVPTAASGEDPATREAGPGRPRRGQGGKRGRKKRDFQRDILPSLVTLSRHEVTEDLQALMQAAGHAWRAGPTRRSFGRGRRRAVVSPPSPPPATTAPEVMLDAGAEVAGPEEDRSSLAGWGKTTRRPRRQRCPAGNQTPLLSN